MRTSHPLARTLVAAGVLAACTAAAAGARPAAGSPPVNASLPTIAGTAREGQTLTASSGSWGGSTPITYAFEWQRCDAQGGGCKAIAGTTNETYQLASADVGHTIRVRVKATNADGSAQATSGPTGVVASIGNAPAATSQPDPSGSAVEGQTLTAAPGDWSGTQPISFAYQWQSCTATNPKCTDVKGANKQTYVVATADIGRRLRYQVTAKNAAGTGTSASNLTAIVAPKADPPANKSAPVVVGTPQVGRQLQAYPGEWTGMTSGSSYAFQWTRCDAAGKTCVDIGGATTVTYVAAGADANLTLRVRVTARNSVGATSAVSAAVLVAPASGGGGGANVVPVTSLKANPDHLLIKQVKFSPSPFASPGGILTVRVRVMLEGTNKNVSGALVELTGIPYAWVNDSPETPTAADGWATIQVQTTKSLPHGGALVFQVRARGPGSTETDILGGISTRRLVQVTLK